MKTLAAWVLPAALALALAGQARLACADVNLLPETTHADRWAWRHAARLPWHAPYYHTQYGQPVALVVPPTANMQTHWNWGVTGTTMTPIYHQFARPYPGYPAGSGPWAPYSGTPAWPASTDQFGVYYIRGPW